LKVAEKAANLLFGRAGTKGREVDTDRLRLSFPPSPFVPNPADGQTAADLPEETAELGLGRTSERTESGEPLLLQLKVEILEHIPRMMERKVTLFQDLGHRVEAGTFHDRPQRVPGRSILLIGQAAK
jgi:hypothetical protein